MSTTSRTDNVPQTPTKAANDKGKQAVSVEEGQDSEEGPYRSNGEAGSTSAHDGDGKVENESGGKRPEIHHGPARISNVNGPEETAVGRNAKTQATPIMELSKRTEDLSPDPHSQAHSISAFRPPALLPEREASPPPPPPPPKDLAYLDPTPRTPRASPAPSRAPSSAGKTVRDPNVLIDFDDDQGKATSGASSDVDFDEKDSSPRTKEVGMESKSEIQSIMDQFDDGHGGPGMEEVMSPRLELAGPLLGGQIQHPPRNSSLEPMKQATTSVHQDVSDVPTLQSPPLDRVAPLDTGPSTSLPPQSPPIRRVSLAQSFDIQSPKTNTPMSPNTVPSLHKPPPPEPDPEPELLFDFHRFLEQLRHRTADPVAKFLRSFLLEFGKKQWMVHEQVKIIGDFLAFITNKMAQCEVWRGVSDAEFDNAREGMEKLVMNRLYAQTFSPAIPPPPALPVAKGKRKNVEKPAGPGRRGQHQEDIERDEILAQKVRIYGWVREEHLDIAPVGESGRRFLILAQQGLTSSFWKLI